MAMAGRPRVPGERVRRFWRAWRAGASVEDAAAEAGVSARAGWGVIADAGGVIPDLAEPSGRYLSLAEREEIMVKVEAGWSDAEIARHLGRHRSTIGRELARNQTLRRPRPGAPAAEAAPLDGRPDGRMSRSAPPAGVPSRARSSRACRRWYRASTAQASAEARARRPKRGKVAANPLLRAQVQAGLQARWSPQQISRVLRRDYPDQPEMQVSHETIYQALYVQGRGELRRELARCLRTGRTIRKSRRRPGQRQQRSPIPNKIMISERPAEAADRAVPGHWEGDLIIGAGGRSAIGTLVERHTRFVMLLHLPGRQAQQDVGGRAEQVRDAMITQMRTLPAALRRSLTWDQGVELARHAEITVALDLPVFFCDPHSPWQRGSNENTNGLLRQYFPKGTDLSVHSPEHLAAVAAELNTRPRMTLGWDSPAQRLAQLLSRPVTTGDVATTP
jgi:IS30 family transposase